MFFRNRCIGGSRGLQHEEKGLCVLGQGAMARMNHVDIAPQSFGIRDPDGNLVELVGPWKQ